MASSLITSWQIDGETMETMIDFIFLGSKITADGDCSHEMKRCLLLGRKAMTNLDSVFKSRDITLLTKVHLVKAMLFPVILYGCESWTIKKAEHQRIDALNCGVGEDSLEPLGLQRRSNQLILRKSVLNIHWKDLCWNCSSNSLAGCCEESTHWKRPLFWERLRAGEESSVREWDGWGASRTQWTWDWARSGRWWGKPGMLQFMGSQRVWHKWATEEYNAKLESSDSI